MTDAASSRSGSSAARRFGKQSTSSSSRQAELEKRREALRVAEELFRHKPDWIAFFREVLGVGGVLSRLFSTPEERAAFEQTAEYAEIQRMLAELRSQSLLRGEIDDKEPTRVITVRLPKSMHEALRAEAYSRQTSINKLCIAKLLQSLENLPKSHEGEDSTPPESDEE